MKDILKALEADPKTTPDQLATMTGKSVTEIKQTIAKAEKDGTIVKYKTVINWPKAGEPEVDALIEVKVQPQKDFGFEAIAEQIYRFAEVRSAYLASGTYDLALIVTGKTMQDVATFVTHKLSPIDGVQGTATHFLMKRYKEDNVIYDDNDGIARLVITP
ncbi:MAG: Lrp/AsnC family transcriptional regulator [Chloroflexi bacterium]|jgi:DNA-binding Lrp family transcriptional regulator|nr:Lrp/AsnC family transcriptional regulator [Chloroflexota bacterium]MBT7080127.1 Lrp/AsnC family transcriptional regulator [Chloroflexota bacterium]MBT7290205.1 Lrp/AsnC family transcriptional regulator [Chloroflexota bacterium]